MLKALLLLPACGALAIAALPLRRAAWMRAMALLASGMTLALALVVAYNFAPDRPGIQFAQATPWNPRLGTSFSLGIDGISLPMVLLAALLGLVAVIASTRVRTNARLYYSLLLLLESALLGVFLARDWSLFYVFWELTLIPLFFLIDRLGGEQRHRAALNFFLYTLGGSVFMLVALLLLYDAAPGHSFDMADIAAGAHGLPQGTQLLIFAGLLIGFGVKMPVFPLHGWLPLAHGEAPGPVSILLSGVLLKMGAYGLLRTAETLPAALTAAQPLLAALAFASLLYGSILAWRQTDLKTMIAYGSIAHMGVVLLGLATLNLAGLTGASLQMLAHGLVAALLFLVVSALYERTHQRSLGSYRGLRQHSPRAAVLLALGFLAAVGLPGSAGFIAELHILVGGFGRWQGTMLLFSTGVLISAAYALRATGHLCFSPAAGTPPPAGDLNRTELLTASVLTGCIVGIGIAPGPLLHISAGALGALARLFGG